MSLIQWKALDTWNPFQELERVFVPAIDVVEGKDSVKIQAEIPGLKKEDIRVALKGDTLTIQGEKKQETESKENGIVRTERTYGSFYRALTLPDTIDRSRINAAYNNGVLELTLAKKAEAQPQQIDVEVK